MVSKAQLTVNDVTDSGFKLLTILTEWMTVSRIAKEVGLSTTQVRRLLGRLESFGLVKEELKFTEHTPNLSSKHFNTTKEGRVFIKRVLKARGELKPESVAPEPIPVVEPIQKESFDLVLWLRQKAQGLRAISDELNAIAENLSVYED